MSKNLDKIIQQFYDGRGDVKDAHQSLRLDYEDSPFQSKWERYIREADFAFSAADLPPDPDGGLREHLKQTEKRFYDNAYYNKSLSSEVFIFMELLAVIVYYALRFALRHFGLDDGAAQWLALTAAVALMICTMIVDAHTVNQDLRIAAECHAARKILQERYGSADMPSDDASSETDTEVPTS